jgi:hypothetical protein
MRQVSILKTTTDLESLEIADRVVTAFVVTADGVEQTTTTEEPIPASLVLLDPETREAVTLESDPLRWADLLPEAYRSGDYHVAVDVVDEDAPVAPVEFGETDEVAALIAQF